MNTATGEMVPARCGRNVCAYCLPLNARRRAFAVAWMAPQRTLTLTNLAPSELPDDEAWQVCRRRYRRVREYLDRAAVDPGLWGVFVERGSDTGMVHAHVVQRGPRPIPKEALQEAAHRAGAGWSRIERVRVSADLSTYVGKSFGVSSYVGKSFGSSTPAGYDALALNGGRLGHFSRGFFSSGAGGTLGVREAERRALLAMRDRDEAASWVLVREASEPPTAGRA